MYNWFFYSLLVLFAVFSKNFIGQINLVPNPSFEEYATDCPVNYHDVPLGWYWWRESPNCFNTCVEPQNLTDSLGWAPWTGFGSQEPFNGEAFIGLSAFSPYPKPGFPPEYREFIGCQLLEPMVVDSSYHVSFRTSLGFIGNYYWVTWACDKLGAIFTTTGDYDWQESPFAVPNFAHVYSEEIISDTTNWVTVEGTFTADQPYTHMALGVFFEFAMLDTLNLIPGFGGLGAYYFIDSVNVQKKVTNSVGSLGELSKIQIIPNPANQQVLIQCDNYMDSCEIVGMDGVVLFEIISPGRSFILDISSYGQGICQVRIRSRGMVYIEKLVVVH